MDAQAQTRTPQHPAHFVGAGGIELTATLYGDGPRPCLLLHGGGQTRHAWKKAGQVLGRSWRVAALDQRGHGQSAWHEGGAYAFWDYAEDAKAVAAQLARDTGFRPVVIGASLGGIAGLLAMDEPGNPPFSALCMVDIVPQMNPDGVDAIQGFMRANAINGFASVEEAADAVAAYLPHRARPKNLDGLRRNLRQGADGRWRWHWDPRFLDGPRSVNTDWEIIREQMLQQAAGLEVPGLLVRGAFSELVTDEAAAEFLAIAKGIRTVRVDKARHMVAGDNNDDFLDSIAGFLDSVTLLQA
jgi:pimeloyl-ACP methyl ester carboxylesterase